MTAISGTTSASYTYYPNGLRKTKTVDGVTTTYVWDGDQLVYETDVTQRKYIRGPMLAASVVGSTKTYYLYDDHGNVFVLTDDQYGAPVRVYAYDAFGNQLNIDTADTNPFRYCVEYYDTETGSYYLRARYYDSSIGRFTQEDPHWNIGNMVYGDDLAAMSRGLLDLDAEYYLPSILAMRQSGNLYTYCVNNPILYTDLSGKGVILTWLAIKATETAGSAAVEGIKTGIIYAINGKSIWAGLVNGLSSGAIEGFISADGPVGKIMSSAIGAAVGAFTEEMVFNNGKIDSSIAV